MELPGATRGIGGTPIPLNLVGPAPPKASKMLRTEGTEAKKAKCLGSDTPLGRRIVECDVAKHTQ